MSIGNTKMQELTGKAKKEADEIRDIMMISRSAYSQRCHAAVEYRHKMERQRKYRERRAKWDRCVAKASAYVYSIRISFLFPEWTAWVDEFLLKSKSTVLFRGNEFMGVHVSKNAVEELVATYKEFQEKNHETDLFSISHGIHGVYFVDEDGNTLHEKGMT